MYNTDINRARSLINETKIIFKEINNKSTIEEIKKLIIDENILTIRASSTRQAAFRSIKKRFFPNNKIDIAIYRFINSSKISKDAKNFLIYYKTAKSDELIYDLTVKKLYNKLKLNESTINTKEILSFFDENVEDHSEISKWSINTKIRLARHYLSIMKDFKFLKGSRVKIILKPQIPLETILYIVFFLKENGILPENILNHDDFKLFLLDYRELITLINIVIRENLLGDNIKGYSIKELIEKKDLEGLINELTGEI